MEFKVKIGAKSAKEAGAKVFLLPYQQKLPNLKWKQAQKKH